MAYKDFTAEEFFHDVNFRNWVLHPDPELNFFWEKWLLNHPEKKEEVSIARKMVKAIQIPEYEWKEGNKEKLWERIVQTNQPDTGKNSKVINLPNVVKAKSGRKLFRETFFKAAVIGGLIIGGLYFFNRQPEAEIAEPVSLIIEKHNPSGQKSKVFLPDGSVVYLNSNSNLSYPQHFEKGRRHVTLTGEAFFEVVSDSLNPFIVETGQLIARVMGTSFNVKDSPEHESTAVSLVKGSVKVISKGNNQEVLLKPGEYAMCDLKSHQLSTGTFDYYKNIAWKDGILYFDETALDKAFTTMEQWYGVKFDFNRPPDQKIRVTGKFDNEYLTNVLKSLSYSVGFDYELHNGNDVKIRFN